MKKYLFKMLYALTSAYTRKDYDNQHLRIPPETNIGKLFAIFAYGLDFIHEQADLIRSWDDIENARGAVLDRYGANFGVKRISSDDEFYRLSIRVKVIAQLSGGDTDTVIRAAGDLLGVDVSNIDFEDVFPSKVALYVDQKLVSENRFELIDSIAESIKRILAAGVGMRLYTRTYRTFKHDITFLRGNYITTEMVSDVVNIDRKNKLLLNNSRFIYALSALKFVPYTKNKAFGTKCDLTYGLLQLSKIKPETVDTEKTLIREEKNTRGTLYHTHITSKKIK